MKNSPPRRPARASSYKSASRRPEWSRVSISWATTSSKRAGAHQARARPHRHRCGGRRSRRGPLGNPAHRPPRLRCCRCRVARGQPGAAGGRVGVRSRLQRQRTVEALPAPGHGAEVTIGLDSHSRASTAGHVRRGLTAAAPARDWLPGAQHLSASIRPDHRVAAQGGGRGSGHRSSTMVGRQRGRGEGPR
jgi:hypothetical protein